MEKKKNHNRMTVKDLKEKLNNVPEEAVINMIGCGEPTSNIDIETSQRGVGETVIKVIGKEPLWRRKYRDE